MTGSSIKKSLANETVLLLLYALAILCIGLFLVQDYGVSYDEEARITYARNSAQAYRVWLDHSFEPNYEPQLMRYSGAFTDVLVVPLIELIQKIAPAISEVDIWHYSYFVYFVIAGLCLFRLARRWFERIASWGILLLFTSQPLIWGHAFMNHADIPFMGLFTASVYAGFKLVDALEQSPQETQTNRTISLKIKRWKTESTHKWYSMPLRYRRIVITISAVLTLLAILLIGGSNHLNEWIARIVQNAYSAEADSLLGRIFFVIAQNGGSIAVDKYVIKAQSLFHTYRNIYIILSIILSLGLYSPVFPWSIPTLTKQNILLFFRRFLASFIQRPVLIAGIILGLASSARILGPLAGLIVSIYALRKSGKSAFAPLFAYAIVALFSMYLTWPYLWVSPIKHFAESISVVSNFPWPGRVLFNGEYYSSTQLPISYLPTLFSIQFTEPVIFLAATGFILSLSDLFVHKKLGITGIFLLWFFIPTFFLIITKRPLYDNFRQILFLTPPLFLLCGKALEVIFRLASKWGLKVFLIALFIFPGVYNVIRLHPYEYIYYNSFVGGVDGAFRRFEADYWMTSFREAAEYLNLVAPPNSKVVVWGRASHLVRLYLRPDIIAEDEVGNTYDLVGGYEYVIASSRIGNDDIYPEELPVFTVKRGNAILAVVKKLSPNSVP